MTNKKPDNLGVHPANLSNTPYVYKLFQDGEVEASTLAESLKKTYLPKRDYYEAFHKKDGNDGTEIPMEESAKIMVGEQLNNLLNLLENPDANKTDQREAYENYIQTYNQQLDTLRSTHIRSQEIVQDQTEKTNDAIMGIDGVYELPENNTPPKRKPGEQFADYFKRTQK